MSNTQSKGFAARADALLSSVETAIDRVADDLDIDVLRSGNVITLTFENGHRIVANSQAAAQEIWVAARSGGFHYRCDESTGHWLDTRSGQNLRTTLSRLIELETGIAPTLSL